MSPSQRQAKMKAERKAQIAKANERKATADARMLTPLNAKGDVWEKRARAKGSRGKRNFGAAFSH